MRRIVFLLLVVALTILVNQTPVKPLDVNATVRQRISMSVTEDLVDGISFEVAYNRQHKAMHFDFVANQPAQIYLSLIDIYGGNDSTDSEVLAMWKTRHSGWNRLGNESVFIDSTGPGKPALVEIVFKADGSEALQQQLPMITIVGE